MHATRLFEPTTLCDEFLANRIAMAPMTRSRALHGAVPCPEAVEYYAQRASAGVIVTEAIGISAQSIGYPRTPGIWTASQQAAWRDIVAAVHGRGGRIIAQLWHVGRVFSKLNNPERLEALAPSAIGAKGVIYTPEGWLELDAPRAMSEAEVARTIADFATAAATALELGFDGVELHSANGYLIEQFLSDQANQRTDGYGGDFERRLAFLNGILSAISDRCCGLSRVGVRLSPFGDFNGLRHSDPEAVFRAVAVLLERRGAGYLHVIEPEVSGDGDKAADTEEIPDVLAIARSLYSGPIVTAGGYDCARAEATLAQGRADVIAFGRPFISNPDLPERMAQGLPLTAWDRATFYTSGPKGYIDYARATGDAEAVKVEI